MRLTVLGSGTGIPSLERGAPGYHLAVGGESCLIDCGGAVLPQLLRLGIPYDALDVLYVTHTHPDHIADLIPLIHALTFPVIERSKPLQVYGPAGFDRFFARIIEPVTGRPGAFDLRIDAVAPGAGIDRGACAVRTAATVHSDRVNSLAYRFEQPDGALLISGDCDWDEGLVDLAAGADLAVLDCSTLQAGKMPGHLSAAECGRLAAQAGLRRIVLSHLYPIEGPDRQRSDECRRHFDGDVVLAADGLVLEVP